jgi:hypothetical protein
MSFESYLITILILNLELVGVHLMASPQTLRLASKTVEPFFIATNLTVTVPQPEPGCWHPLALEVLL